MHNGRRCGSFLACAAILACACLPPTRASAGDAWVEIARPARIGHVAVFDAKHHRMVVFGGGPDSDLLHDDVWVLTPGKPHPWERAVPLGEPPSARTGAAAVYDAARDRMLVIGGRDPGGVRNDVWELSLEGRFRWRELHPEGTPPPARANHTATLDPEHDRVFVFGGQFDYFGSLDDLWQLSLSPRLAWTRVAQAGPSPYRREWHSAVYAPDLHGIIVFGGLSLCSLGYDWTICDVPDTWFLSTRDTPAWADLTGRIRGDPPCGHFGHIAAYDAATSRMVVFGGYAWSWNSASSCRPTLAEIWSLSMTDSAWSSSSLDGAGPDALVYATCVVDPERQQLLLHGGGRNPIEGGFAHNETWALSLARPPAWSRVEPESASVRPSGFYGQSAIYDPERDRMLLYQDQQLWAYSFHDHGGWTRVATSGNPPPARSQHATVYDSKRNRMIVYGGKGSAGKYLADAWALTLGKDPEWCQIVTRDEGPARAGAAAIYDPIRDRLISFGGDSAYWVKGDVWALPLATGSEWTQLLPHLSWEHSRSHSSAIYDSKRDAMVIFGGGIRVDGWAGTNDTWEIPLSGPPGWRQLTKQEWSSSTPGYRMYQAAIYDPAGDRMIIVGGCVPSYYSAGPWPDSWALDLSTLAWSRLSSWGNPPPMWAEPLAVYDSRRSRVFVVEGDQTWALELAGEHARRPDSVAVRGSTLRASGLDDPQPASLALHGVSPNPSAGTCAAEFSLPDAAPAMLELLDLAGRRLWQQAVGALGPGRHAVAVAAGMRLPAGLYLLRLAHGRLTLTSKVVRLK